MNARTRDKYERIAAIFDILDIPSEIIGKRPLRKAICQNVSGRVLEAGIGTGLNIPYYPRGCELVGTDISAGMLAVAAKRAEKLGRAVELHEMDVCDMKFPDHHFDVVIATFVLCAVRPNQLQAMKELARICKPGGEIRWLDYSLSREPVKRFMMRAWSPWISYVYGASYDNRFEDLTGEAGLEVLEQRYVLKDMVKLFVARPVNGHARNGNANGNGMAAETVRHTRASHTEQRADA